ERTRPARMLEPFDGVPLVEHVALRLAEAVDVIDAADAGVERAVGRVLQLGVERGLHREAVLIELLGAVAALEILAHLFDEGQRHQTRASLRARQTGSRRPGLVS